MKKTILCAGAGLLVTACGALQAPALPDDRAALPLPPVAWEVAAFERACLSDPMNAAHWERLAAALEADGQRERAGKMREQAASLRTHDARRDYALLRERGVAAEAAPSSSMPRTQVRRIGAALVQVERIAAVTESTPESTPQAAPQSALVLVRLEISNGNGITGAAARLGRSLDEEGWKRVRLTNAENFNVPFSRIEYRPPQQVVAQSLAQRLGLPLTQTGMAPQRADLRIVLGHDVRPGNAGSKKNRPCGGGPPGR